MAEGAGLHQLEAHPLDFDTTRLGHRSGVFRALAHVYAMLAKAPLLRTLLLVAGPVFQAMFTKEKTK